MPAVQDGDDKRVRVMVVDDSVVMRRLLTDTLRTDPALEVIGSASNGELALEKIAYLRPDVVILDVEMPVVNGIETLQRIRQRYPEVRVIMCGAATKPGAAITNEALCSGASDYVCKPAGDSAENTSALLRKQLIPKIKQFFAGEPMRERAGTSRVRGSALGASRVRRQVVAIGVSTGGPAALAVLLRELPAAFSLPVLIVQHMPPTFTGYLAQQLRAHTRLTVREATHGAVVEPGQVIIAPGDYHLRVARSGQSIVTLLDQSEPENSCRPAVDVLFRSVAEVYGASALGVVLTGMGHDGLRGASALKAVGASVVVQDEASSVVWGMPGQVARAGLADAVISLNQMAAALVPNG